jgi:hypothetical protein
MLGAWNLTFKPSSATIAWALAELKGSGGPPSEVSKLAEVEVARAEAPVEDPQTETIAPEPPEDQETAQEASARGRATA